MLFKKVIKSSFLFITLLCICFTTKAQKNIERFLKFRHEDSVWFVLSGAFAVDRFFIGNTQVRFRTWRNHLTLADAEVGDLMKKGTTLRRKSTYVGCGGLALVLAGTRIVRANSRSWGVPNEAKQKTGHIMWGTGAVAIIISTVMEAKVWRLYTSGQRLFNNKVRQGKLKSFNFQIQATPTHAGLVFEW